MLLIDHYQAEILELDVFRNQRVSADHYVCHSVRGHALERFLVARLGRARQQDDEIVRRFQQLLEVEIVLRCQDFGRGHHRYLIVILQGDHAGLECNDGLAAADVALQQPIHR